MSDRRSRVALGLLLVMPACGGDTAAPARVVELSVTDTLRFDPSTVTAKAGERVTFRITNAGKAAHELVIGDADFHTAHRDAMASGDGHGGHSHAAGGSGAAVDVLAGQTATLAFTMPATAPPFACYVDGHAAAGMVGTVVYD